MRRLPHSQIRRNSLISCLTKCHRGTNLAHDREHQNDELKATIARANELLVERYRARKAQAAQRIKEIAAQAGLSVEVKGTGKRRERPPKNRKNGAKQVGQAAPDS